jgi:hypothetical protein
LLFLAHVMPGNAHPSVPWSWVCMTVWFVLMILDRAGVIKVL